MRRFGERIAQGRTYRDRPGIYAVIRKGGDLLLTLQMEPEPEYQLPGGGIDPGENHLQALHREVVEETGWSIVIERRLGIFQRYCFMPEYDLWARKICHVYLAHAALKISEPLESHHRAVWVPPAAAARLVGGDGDRYFVSQAMG